ncbi:MAG: MFS transporter [Alkalilacustris sp.]
MSAVPQTPSASSPHALSYPGFRRHYVGAVCGTNGNWISRVLMAWLAWDLTGSPTFVGAVAAASLLPVAVCGPVFGAVIDRMPTGLAFRRASIALLAVPTLLLAALLLDVLGPGLLFVLSLLFGVVMSAYHPVRQSLGPRLVDRPAIGSVVALDALNFNIGRMLAPALGGAVIAAGGTLPAACIGVLLALPNALIAPTLRPREGDHSRHGRLGADLRAGFAIVWSRWPLLRSMLLAVAALGLMRGVSEILALVADGQFARGAAGLGLLTSAVGGGALLAAIFQVRLKGRLVRNQPLRLAVIVAGFGGVLGLVNAPAFAWAVVAATVLGFAATFVAVSLQIGLQARLEDEFRGRVMSIWMLANTASTSLLAFAIALVTGWVGLAMATGLFVTICALAVAAIWVRPLRV